MECVTMENAEEEEKASEPAEAPVPPNNPFLEAIKNEGQLIRVPYEGLKKSIRATGKLVEKELGVLAAGVSEAATKGMSKEEADKHIDGLVSRLQGLKRKLDESNRSEVMQLQRCRARLDHLSMLTTGEKDLEEQWNKLRVDRILVDYLLRSSYYESALMLAQSSGIKDLVDTEVFLEARRVVSALRRGDCSEALAWCHENKTKLKKTKSKLEFKLRIQEFIELVRAEHRLEAVRYAQKHLSTWAASNMRELQQAMATLAFKKDTDCAIYKSLFDVKQWEALIESFHCENLRLHSMTSESLLRIHLQAGLSALKTPFCYEEGCSKEDPLSQPEFRTLAEHLPFSKHMHSKVFCWITKELMNEHNPPLVLPNGYIYSQKAMEEMASRNNGVIVCPRTGFTTTLGSLAKAYIS